MKDYGVQYIAQYNGHCIMVYVYICDCVFRAFTANIHKLTI